MQKYILLLFFVLNSVNAMPHHYLVSGKVEPDKDLMFAVDDRPKAKVVSVQTYNMDTLSYYASHHKLSRIVSFDGGGVRGIGAASWCSDFEHYASKPMADMFNLFAGTSTGGIIATSLVLENPSLPGTCLYSADDVVGLYHNECRKIFTKRSWFGYLTKSKYRTSTAYAVYDKYFSNIKLSQLRSDCDLLIPYYNLTNNRPGFFKSHKARDPMLVKLRDYYLKDVIASTTAAPTYFKAYNLYTAYRKDHPKAYQNNFISVVDGGVFANDPSICALAEGMSLYNLSDACLLVSMGTGRCIHELTPEGLLGWASHISSIIMKNTTEMSHHLLSKFSDAASKKPVFFSRLQFDISAWHTEMDNVSNTNMSYLEHQAQRSDEALDKIKKISQILRDTDKPLRESLIGQSVFVQNQFFEI